MITQDVQRCYLAVETLIFSFSDNTLVSFSVRRGLLSMMVLAISETCCEVLLGVKAEQPFSVRRPPGMFRQLLRMTGLQSCTDDCSGRGECHNGTCLCEIRYAGDHCDGPNLPYHASIGSVFLLVALVCAIQLIMCITSEYRRLKAPTFLKACRMTTQKLLYFVTFLASAIRGGYFLFPDNFQYGWSRSLLSAYYPVLMSGSSLVVCFWAEVFHLRDICWERSQFLSKSFFGFVTFNIISYSLLLAEVLTTHIASTPNDDKHFYAHLFNGCYAVLLFIVVVFFLIYGVEVFFKVRGGFIAKPVRIVGEVGEAALSQQETEPLHEEEKLPPQRQQQQQQDALRPRINNSQLHQSRIGLLSQALMLMIIVGFLFSETLSEFWKTKVPVYSRNWHDVVFRVVEIGVAIWFPAVLWNCMKPSELWILNPRKLLTRLDQQQQQQQQYSHPQQQQQSRSADGDSPDGPVTEVVVVETRECWICYDGDKTEPLIRPCACTGDVSSVHHDCLRRWLMESVGGTTAAAATAVATDKRLHCKVCKEPYDVRTSARLDWERGFTAHHWGSTAVIVTCLCVAVAGAWIVIQLFEDSYIRMLSASAALLVIYVCIKFLSQNTVSAYQRAKMGALSISNHVTTISGNVTTIGAEPSETQAVI
ncbi:hypothetical protein Trydic_g18251 [Trypoxylus dichotomus]